MGSARHSDTIVALATAQGISAIAVIRLSGNDAIVITDKIFKGKKLQGQNSHTIHFGNLVDDDKIIDEVLISVFKEPNSFTKENVIMLSGKVITGGAGNWGEIPMTAHVDLSQADSEKMVYYILSLDGEDYQE